MKIDKKEKLIILLGVALILAGFGLVFQHLKIVELQTLIESLPKPKLWYI